jgi:ABC-2 family transporter
LYIEPLSYRQSLLGLLSSTYRTQQPHISLAEVFSSCKSYVFIISSIFPDPSPSSVFIPALFSMAEIPALFAKRPIILRHQKAAMYHPMVEALALTLVDVPFTLATMILFAIIIYFIVGLQTSAAQFLCVYFTWIFLDFGLTFPP